MLANAYGGGEEEKAGKLQLQWTCLFQLVWYLRVNLIEELCVRLCFWEGKTALNVFMCQEINSFLFADSYKRTRRRPLARHRFGFRLPTHFVAHFNTSGLLADIVIILWQNGE